MTQLDTQTTYSGSYSVFAAVSSRIPREVVCRLNSR
jgi:hypothetical protein